MTDQKFMDAIKAFEASPLRAKAVGAEAVGLPQICPIYKEVRPILEGVLPFIKLIPVYGATIFAAITALIGVLDKVCP